MYLNLLTPRQQRVFLQAARSVAEQDGLRADVEDALLNALHTECGSLPRAQPSVEPLDATLEAAGEALDSRLACRVFMLELAGVATVDGSAEPAEVSVLRAFGDRLGVSDEELAEYFDFGLEVRALAIRGRELIAVGREAD